MTAPESMPPLHGDKHGGVRYWPTAKAFIAFGFPVPGYITRRDEEATYDHR